MTDARDIDATQITVPPQRGTELRVAPAETIADVLERMRAVEAFFPAADGLVAFNAVYRQVTERMLSLVAVGTFANPAFLESLDVVFANSYFSGAGLDGAGRSPRCWQTILDHRHRTDVHPLQFALAGMNAHITHDLVLAVVDTCEQLGVEPDGTVKETYFQVNEVLDDLEHAIRPLYLHGVLEQCDDVATVEDLFACWSITSARAGAWDNAQLLWRLREHDFLRGEFLFALDAGTAAVSAFLLAPMHAQFRMRLPLPGWHPRLI